MYCSKCGIKNPDNGRYCRSCGADLGNLTAALSGKSTKMQYVVDTRKRGVSWEQAITKISIGLGFLIVSLILGYSGKFGAEVWWFWLLIPAFGSLGSGIAQVIQLKKLEKQEAAFESQNTSNVINSAPDKNSLSPTKTDYVEPSKQTIYDTGDLVERPASVTEGTTRHLHLDNEGETMTLPKK